MNALGSPSSGHAVMQKRKKKRSLDLTKPVERPKMPFGILLRMFVIGSLAVGASGYAIYRHYCVPRPSMLRPAPPPEPLPSGFVPVPELVPVPETAPSR
ncbi:MAG: hypothetical protein JWP87_5342 [Labilithrix sp.]|nr:hypothetical protein [Labilithrix sp.]